MFAISVSPAFYKAVLIASNDDNEYDDDYHESGDGPKQRSNWKQTKKTRKSGPKGRTPKHPMNKRPYTC